MTKTIVGDKRRYHIDNLIYSSSLGDVYAAFARRRAGKKLRRRYYALLMSKPGVSDLDFNVCLQQSMMSLPFPARIEEVFWQGEQRCVVLAKGFPAKTKVSRLSALANKGFLMLFLAALILILIIIRFFQ